MTNAKADKTIKSVKVMKEKNNITKKTIKLESGKSMALKVKSNPGIPVKNIIFSSSQKTVASVSKKGKVTAKIPMQEVGMAGLMIRLKNWKLPQRS